MDRSITKERFKQALSVDIERLLNEVVETVNHAKPGRIIDDGEEPVCDGVGHFRRRLSEKALELRGQREASSPLRPPQESRQVGS